jgi:hypothetical protein
MAWQDIIVLSIGSWIFIAALIPSLTSKDKPPVSSSITTGSVLLVYAVVYITLDLWLSVVSTAIMALVWLTIGWQKYKMNKVPAITTV